VHGDVFAKRAVERFDKVRRGHGLLAFRRWGKKVGLEGAGPGHRRLVQQ
jgi:hypothetical protein